MSAPHDADTEPESYEESPGVVVADARDAGDEWCHVGTNETFGIITRNKKDTNGFIGILQGLYNQRNPCEKKSMKTEKQISLRLTNAEFSLLKTVSTRTGATPQAIIRKLLEALDGHYSEHEEITFPIHLATAYEVTKASGTVEKQTKKRLVK